MKTKQKNSSRVPAADVREISFGVVAGQAAFLLLFLAF